MGMRSGFLVGVGCMLLLTNPIAARAEPRPSAAAIIEQAQLAETAKDAPRAIQLYGKAAGMGDVSAMVKLGLVYRDGLGLQKLDHVKALYWLSRAASRGSREAMLRAGGMYEYGGRRLPLDGCAALKWYRKADRAGLSEAALNVSEAYEFGTCGRPNYALALKYAIKAKQAGVEDADRFIDRVERAFSWQYEYPTYDDCKKPALRNTLLCTS